MNQEVTGKSERVEKHGGDHQLGAVQPAVGAFGNPHAEPYAANDCNCREHTEDACGYAKLSCEINSQKR
ncbi:hypothetical protein D3C75_1167040 [compost metagenome]